MHHGSYLSPRDHSRLPAPVSSSSTRSTVLQTSKIYSEGPIERCIPTRRPYYFRSEKNQSDPRVSQTSSTRGRSRASNSQEYPSSKLGEKESHKKTYVRTALFHLTECLTVVPLGSGKRKVKIGITYKVQQWPNTI